MRFLGSKKKGKKGKDKGEGREESPPVTSPHHQKQQNAAHKNPVTGSPKLL